MRNTPGLLTFSSLALLLVFSLALNAAYWTDDFIFSLRLQNKGILAYMWDGYLTWDGRFFSLPGLAQALLIKNTHAPGAVLFWSGCLFLSAFLMGKFLMKDDVNPGFSVTSRLHYLDAVVLFLFVWFGFYFHLSETVYRVVGGFYIFSVALALLWLYFYVKRPEAIKTLWLIPGFLISLAVGLMGANGSFTLISFIVLDLVLRRRYYLQNRHLLWFPLLWGTALAISTVFIIAAPGNFVRAAHHESSFVFDPVMTVYYFFEIFSRYTYYSLPAIAAATVLAIIFPFSNSLIKGVRFTVPRFKSIISIAFPKDFDTLLRRYFWLLLAISSIIPMLAVPEITSRRTSVFYMTFLFIWVMGFVRNIIHHPLPEYKIAFKVQLKPGSIRNFLYLFLMVTTLTAVYQFSLGYNIKRQVILREQHLAEMQGQVDTVYVNPIVVDKIPFTYKFHDYLHKAYATYYGFDKVILDTTAVKELPYYYITPP